MAYHTPNLQIKHSLRKSSLLFDDGQDSLIKKHTLSVTPNPFHDLLEITYLSNPDAQVEISIIDLNGKVVQKVCNCQTDAKGMLKRKIDARDFSPGSYLIKVNENGRIVTGKLVKWE